MLSRIHRVLGAFLPAALLLATMAARGAAAQEPVPPAAAPPDSLAADEVLEVRNLPFAGSLAPAGWSTGIWEWDREGLQSTRALTLLELLEEITGVIALRGGDFGQPSSATAFGVGGGRLRVFLDGIELPPLQGGIVDLSRMGLGGIDRVRVERRPGELRIELYPLHLSDPRPYSLLEVGTGDLNTNLFRGTFAHPDALGGSVMISLDRVDTEGPQALEPGASFGAHLRHTIHVGERGGLAWELRRMTSRRPEALWSPRGVNRTDLALHGRFEPSPGLVLAAFAQRSSLGADYGRGATPPEVPEVNEDPRTQAGLRVAVEREWWWGEAGGFAGWGHGWIANGLSGRLGGRIPGWVGAEVSFDRESWRDDEAATTTHARGWTEPLLGFSFFGEVEDGRRGIPRWMPPELEEMPGEEDPMEDNPVGEEPPVAPSPLSFTEWRGVRGGAEFRWNGIFLGGAAMRIEADSLHPMGTEADREGLVLAGGERTGFEVAGELPLTPLLDGLALAGSVQIWDDTESWRYLPRRIYEGRLRFHDVFLESENLEVWLDVGVRGRDPMFVPFEEAGPPGILAEVPFAQSWFGRLQIRIASARIFVLWDNFTLRESNQDFPGRLLPPTRALYGVRWTLWN
ncbi:MAG: TonB-dependent receptor plug domain-containing protein [Gemmatimonadota bacterium]